MDSIRLEGVKCRVHLGVPDAERRRRQKVLVDLELRLDLSRAAATDAVEDTVDYASLERILRETAEAGEWRLVERLACALARAALDFDGRIAAASAAVHKRPAVMKRTREVVVRVELAREG